MPEFNSVFELDKALQPILKSVVEAVGKKAEAKVKEYIESEVYSYHGNYYYDGTGNRTGEFKESWTTSDAKNIGDGYQVEVSSDPSKMRFDADTFLHGSYAGDVRGFLGEIINEGLAGSLFGSGFWDEKRPFFDKTIQDLVDNGLIDKWFKEEFLKHGITVS